MTTAIQKTPEEKAVEFVPFGAQDKIKLTVRLIQNMIAVPTKSGKTCSERDALKFLMLCRARRLDPFVGDAFLLGYDTKDGGAQFSLITAHQAFMKRAETHPEFDGMKSGVIVEDNGKVLELEGDFHTDDQTLLGGWATVFFKQRKVPSHDKLALKNFMKKWLDGSPMGRWKDDPEGLIVKCAESSALRKAFPTMLGGMYSQEEGGRNLSETPMPPAELNNTHEPAAQIEAGNASQESPPASKTDAETPDTPQFSLSKLAFENSLTFDDYQKWGVESGNDPEARSRGTWDEVPADLAKRLLRAKAGFVDGMKKVKGVV